MTTENNFKRYLSLPTSWQSFGLGFAVWTILGLSFASESYLRNYKAGRILSVHYFIIEFLTEFYLYALFSLLVFKLGEKFPLTLELNSRNISTYIFHLINSVIFSFANVFIGSFIAWAWEDICENCLTWQMMLDPHFLHRGIVVYWGIIIVGQGIEYYREMQSEKVRVAQLSAQLSEAQLSALKMQIHPHFLFNTLNSIVTLVHEDAEAADSMINRLSEFLRMTLQNTGEPMVTLRSEFNFLKTYLEIEKVRFQERLAVEFMAEESILSAKVPNLILQPLVENSIKHGIAKNKGKGILKISAQKIGERLQIEIVDNGQGNLDSKPVKNYVGGVGLSNTYARLEQIYSDNYSFEITQNKQTGTLVSLNVPFEN